MNWSKCRLMLFFRDDASFRSCFVRNTAILPSQHKITRYLACCDQSIKRRTNYGNWSNICGFGNQSVISLSRQNCSPSSEDQRLPSYSRISCSMRLFHSLRSSSEKNLYNSNLRTISNSKQHTTTSKKFPPDGEKDRKINLNSSKPGGVATDKNTVTPPGEDGKSGDDSTEADSVASTESSPSIWQRFRDMSKRYGKILLTVHVFTSTIWGGIFYYAAVSGFDVVEFLRWIGASETLIRPFTLPSIGHAAVAYLLYKSFTPLRYLTTIGGTQLAVRYLRKFGYLPPVDKTTTIQLMVKQRTKERFTRDPKK